MVHDPSAVERRRIRVRAGVWSYPIVPNGYDCANPPAAMDLSRTDHAAGRVVRPVGYRLASDSRMLSGMSKFP